ncbi:TlpA family protein disulfide reductase [Marinilabilia rubra]|uniref:Alkyl hydroperoxide reductase n=1 Tax=Marinilabilia rubra TaxID=2162893 RepID=A0A2U2BEL8_9BACT|nr:TlpA disulfide reductase family protein [Marinilabilia rubra]PWE01467.1 alkyl hydroperoxide reductase [Marinilabilia rubra]
MRNKLLLITILAGFVFLSFINGSPEPRDGLQVGNKIPSINQPLLDGTAFTTDSLKGKMVLLDFWASYDAPSRVESSAKKELIRKYNNHKFLNGKDFVIVSISLDRFKSPLMQVIKRDQLNEMYHICNFKGRNSEIAKKFQTTEDMTNYLVDGHGRIVSVSKNMEKIDETLARLQQ